MAKKSKKRSKFKTVLFLSLLGLAAFGGFTLWQKHGSSAQRAISSAADSARSTGKAASKRYEKIKDALK